MKTISRYIMTLALLLTAVTGAWASGEIVVTVTAADLQADLSNPFTKDGVTITCSDRMHDGLAFNELFEFSTTLGYFTKIEITNKFPEGISGLNGVNGFSVNGSVATWTGKASSVGMGHYSVGPVEQFVFTIEPAGPTVAWNASTKTGTFTMPGSDVVLTPIYAKAAAFATTGTGSEMTTLLPAAAEGVIAGTDASLIAEGTGIVAFAGTSTEVTQGTLMYAIGTSATEAPALTDFSATVPTAKDIADDGATVYVWYYIQGADAPDGVAATLDNTFDNTEPACLTVTVLTNKFDIQFNAANANTIEAGKATVTVDGTAATVTEGKLEGVKMGTEVKMTAKEGYKFRKVEVKKKAAATPLDNTTTAWTAGTFAVPAGGLTYSDAITVSGDVTLVLTDGETLTLNKGISLAEGATLTVEGNGTMNVNGTNESTASTVAGSGTLVLTSGTLNAKGGNGAGVGYRTSNRDNRANAGGNAINGNVTVSGGTLTAKGGNGGGVEQSSSNSYGAVGGVAISGSVTVTDGTVTATGGNGGGVAIWCNNSYGGAGGAAIGGDATVNGGTWTASDGTHGANGDGQGGDGGKAVAGTVTDNRN